ncbi:Cap15 family cyclic dinucleotide receptor domain-containing protein [Serratia marcescens]|uniref:Cap15 family cyclic dinucleotide receptor domain-containing protein n=1 Tax=Serratia marcescens TaxID=615 RepID=UPI003FA7A8AD|nr:hypothetical protein [Serratia marcescens]
MSQILNVPDLRGEWICRGKTLNADGKVTYLWEGIVTITQCWDKLRIQLNTATSTSNSICAALLFDEIERLSDPL